MVDRPRDSFWNDTDSSIVNTTKSFSFYFSVYGLHIRVYTMYMPGAQGDQMRAWDTLELEL